MGRPNLTGPYLVDVVLPCVHDDCLTWPFARHESGYGQVWHDGKVWATHRLVCTLAHGEPPTPKHEAAHTCGHGSDGCVNPNHLYWATPTQNQHDKIAHGTHNRGERSGLAKLDEWEVDYVRFMRGTVTQKELAAVFGIDRSTVSQIQTGARWAHV